RGPQLASHPGGDLKGPGAHAVVPRLDDASPATRLPKPLAEWLCFVSPVSG
ncbi:unnamed protein product, partial [Rangifer tarandus platyrhynchus]